MQANTQVRSASRGVARPVGRTGTKARLAVIARRSEKLPSTYDAALKDDWVVVDDRTPLIHGSGVITMKKDGVSFRLTIGYSATGTGYVYTAPKVAK
jgi:hypothetical protein